MKSLHGQACPRAGPARPALSTPRSLLLRLGLGVVPGSLPWSTHCCPRRRIAGSESPWQAGPCRLSLSRGAAPQGMGAVRDAGDAHGVLLGKLMVPLILVSASDELKNKTVCEDHELKLHCHESKFLNIYSATYGRRTQERDVCSSEAGRLPPFGRCLMWVLSGCCLRILGLRSPLAGTLARGKVKGEGNPSPGSASFCPQPIA